MALQKTTNMRKFNFRDLKISHKFGLIIAVVLIGFAVIGLVYQSVLNTQNQSIQQSEQVNALGALIDKIEISMLNARALQKDFQLSNQLEYLEKFDTTLTVAQDDVVKLGTYLEEKALLEQLKTLLESYQADFYTLAEVAVELGLNGSSGARGDMTLASNSLEDALSSSGRALLTSLLSVRQLETAFVESPTETTLTPYQAELNQFSDQVQTFIDKSVKTKSAKASLSQSLLLFQKQSQGLVESVEQQKAQIRKIADTLSSMSPILDQMLSVRDQFRQESIESAATSRKSNTILFLTTLVLAAGLISMFVVLLSRQIAASITQPIAHLQSVVDQIADGDFSVRATLDTEDELGRLSSALNDLLDERDVRLQLAEEDTERLNESVIGLLQAVAQLSQRDLTIKAPVTEDIAGPVGDAINLLVSETAEVLEEVRTVSLSVADSSNAVKSHSDKVVEVAATEAETVELTVTELSNAAATMDEINHLAQSSNDAADKASRATLEALSKVTSTVNSIDTIRETIRETEKRTKRLGERTQEITGTVNIINNIAERTHILALNASMHAASAGEAGRGFAVVADEVQRLAENAREATAQISGLVNSIQMETSDTLDTMNKAITQVVDGTELAQQAGEQMKETQQSTEDLVQLVQNIASNSRDQAQATSHLRSRAEEIRESTRETRRSLDEQSEQTHQLLNFSQQLLTKVDIFKLPSSEENLVVPLHTSPESAVEEDDASFARKAG